MYYSMIKHDGHLRTWGKRREHSPAALVFFISQVLSNVWSVLTQCFTWSRLLHLLYDKEVLWQKAIKHTFSMFYTLTKHGFLTNQSTHRVLSTCSQTSITGLDLLELKKSSDNWGSTVVFTRKKDNLLSHTIILGKKSQNSICFA